MKVNDVFSKKGVISRYSNSAFLPNAAFITVRTPVNSTDMNGFFEIFSIFGTSYLATRLDTMRVGTTPGPILVDMRVGANDTDTNPVNRNTKNLKQTCTECIRRHITNSFT